MNGNKYILLRHGRTQFNKEKRLQGGDVDSPLLPDSIENMRLVGDHLVNDGYQFDYLFVSPIKRVVDSLEPLALESLVKDKSNLIFDERLKELYFGKYAGMTYDDIPEDIMQKRFKDKWSFVWEGGESMRQMQHRVIDFIESTFSNIHNSKVAILSHSVTTILLLGYLCNLSEDDIVKSNIPNYSFYKIKDGKYDLVHVIDPSYQETYWTKA